MTKKEVSGKNPTANLAINKSRIKKYGKKKSIPSYYLEKGQEFQIELYNPTQEKVLTTIKLNNNPISGGLILRPGERVFLDRFLDTNKKFLFDTYEVDNTKSARKAIEPNGDVEIAFFKEIIPINNVGGVTLDWMVDDLGTGSNNFIDLSTGNITNTTLYSDSNLDNNSNLDNDITFSTTGTAGVGNSSPTSNLSVSDNVIGESLRSVKGSKSSGFLTSGKVANIGLNFMSKPLKSKKSSTPTTIETGRVEKGSESDQTLCEGNGDFEMTSFHVVRYKLIPKSQKKLSTKDYYTKYCGNCGAKCKTKFCPYCGAKQ